MGYSLRTIDLVFVKEAYFKEQIPHMIVGYTAMVCAWDAVGKHLKVVITEWDIWEIKYLLLIFPAFGDSKYSRVLFKLFQVKEKRVCFGNTLKKKAICKLFWKLWPSFACVFANRPNRFSSHRLIKVLWGKSDFSITMHTGFWNKYVLF